MAIAGEGSYLGIGIQEVDAERAKALNLKEERGAEVTKVNEGSPAAKAGFKEHDVVLDYNGEAVEGVDQLIRLVHETPVDRQVKIKVWRDGRTETLTATIGRGSSSSMDIFGPSGSFTIPEIHINPPQIDIPRFQMNWQNPRMGIVGEALGEEPQFAELFGVKEGVLVKSVTKDSAAEKAGIKVGDVVTKVGDATVKSTSDITNALRNMNKTSFPVTVVRNKKETSVTVTMDTPSRMRGDMRPIRAVRV